MLTVTSAAFNDSLHVGEDEIILNGPPGDLRGTIFLSNNNLETLKVKSFALNDGNSKQLKGAAAVAGNTLLQLSCKLQPGESKLENIHHTIHPYTPPGIYETEMQAGGSSRKVKMVVQPHIDIDIYPATFTFQETAPGNTHTAIFTLTNKGNMPFQIPDVKHVAPLDMDMLCRAFGFAFRGKGSEGLMSTFDEITKNIQNSLPEWAAASVKENGKILQPGQSCMVHLAITLPKNSDARKDYSGVARFWDKDIAFVIKSHNDNKNY
jgi:hypothetical protein